MGMALLEKSSLRAKYEWGNVPLVHPPDGVRTPRLVLSFYGEPGKSQITLASQRGLQTLGEIEFLCPSKK